MTTMMMMGTSMRRLAARDGGRLVMRARSTTTADLGGLSEAVKDHGTPGRCPIPLPVAERETPSAESKPMNQLGGPVGWPIVGNFLTYLKKENQGKMHEVQVGPA